MVTEETGFRLSVRRAMSIFNELKRRNVFRIAAAYLIVGWLLMQVASVVVPALRLPEWVTTLVVFLLLIGFPVALLLAWAYELTPEGFRRTEDESSRLEGAPAGIRRLDAAIIVLFGIAIIGLVADRWAREPAEATRAGMSSTVSIAVLPFLNMSDDPGQDPFADGLTDQLLNSLVALEGLRVISRTSSFALRGQALSMPEIGKLLSATHVLEGSVRRDGATVRVTAQLIEAATDSHLWSQSYDRELSVGSVLDIQDDIADTVATALHTRLRPDQRASRIGGSRPDSLAALDHYYEGMGVIRIVEIDVPPAETHQELFDRGAAAFAAAIAEDPDWAPAYAAMGRLYHFMKHLGDGSEMLRISRQYLDEALRLDPALGAAWASLGYVDTMEDRYDEAFAAYDRASELGVDSSWGRAILLNRLGRWDEAARAYRNAASHDPLSLNVKEQLLFSLRCGGRYPEMVGVANEILEASPDARHVRQALAYALVRTGKGGQGLALAEEVAAEVGSDSAIADVLAVTGQRERALAAVRSESTSREWLVRAPAAIILGEPSLALDILELAEDDFGPRSWILCAPELRGMAGNPRFDALVQRVSARE